MFKAEHIAVQYVPSDSIGHQGNKRSIDHYLRKGYYVKEQRNGFWLLIRPAKVMVTGYCGDNGNYTHNMKDGILEYYGRARISQKLIGIFRQDFANGNLSVEVDETGYAIK